MTPFMWIPLLLMTDGGNNYLVFKSFWMTNFLTISFFSSKNDDEELCFFKLFGFRSDLIIFDMNWKEYEYEMFLIPIYFLTIKVTFIVIFCPEYHSKNRLWIFGHDESCLSKIHQPSTFCLRPNLILKPNYFKKQCSSSLFLLT